MTLDYPRGASAAVTETLPNEASLPKRAIHVTERLVDGELVLYDPVRQFVHALNATAAFIWSSCDGQTDPSKIAAMLCELYPASADSIRTDVEEALQLFRLEGLLAA